MDTIKLPKGVTHDAIYRALSHAKSNGYWHMSTSNHPNWDVELHNQMNVLLTLPPPDYNIGVKVNHGVHDWRIIYTGSDNDHNKIVNAKVVIEVKGGMVTSVYADRHIEYVLVDWDNINTGDGIESITVSVPDEINSPISSLFTTKRDAELADALKKLNF